MNKKRELAETEQRRKARMSTISDEHSQKATGCASPERGRIEPDPQSQPRSPKYSPGTLRKPL